MAEKERKGGELTNKDIEQELERKGMGDKAGGYKGSQDTGDNKVRAFGTKVQKSDGLLPDDDKEHPDT